MATRPADVPADAVLIVPGPTQQKTLLSIARNVARDNIRIMVDYGIDLMTWAANMATLNPGNPPPPLPVRPEVNELHVYYADYNGKQVKDVQALGGDCYAWVWQSRETATLSKSG